MRPFKSLSENCGAGFSCGETLTGEKAIISAANTIPCSVMVGLKEATQERRGSVGDTHNLVGRLTIKLEVEFSLRPAVLPVGEEFQLASSKTTLRERVTPDSNTDARRLPDDPALLWNRLS